MKKSKIPQIKKDIKAFLTSEEGRINKKDAAKIAMSLLVLGVALTGTMKPESISAGTCNCCTPCPSHCSHSSHSSHGSY